MPERDAVFIERSYSTVLRFGYLHAVNFKSSIIQAINVANFHPCWKSEAKQGEIIGTPHGGMPLHKASPSFRQRRGHTVTAPLADGLAEVLAHRLPTVFSTLSQGHIQTDFKS